MKTSQKSFEPMAKRKTLCFFLLLLLFSTKAISQGTNYHPKKLIDFHGSPVLISTNTELVNYDAVMVFNQSENSLKVMATHTIIYNPVCAKTKLYYFATDDYSNVTLYCNHKPVKALWNSVNYPKEIAVYGDTILFKNYDDYKGSELWMSDGTSQGTKLLLDLNPGEKNSEPHGFYINGDYLLFIAHGPSGNYNELWLLNLKTNEKKLIADNFMTSVSGGSNDSENMNVINGELLIYIGNIKTGMNKGNQGLFSYDLRTGALSEIIDFEYKNSERIKMTALENYVIFAARDTELGYELWVTNGTKEGTRLLKDINEGYLPSNPFGFAVVNKSRAYFFADDGVHGREIWVVDSTLTTKLLSEKVIDPGIFDYAFYRFYPVNNNLYVAIGNGTIWKFGNNKNKEGAFIREYNKEGLFLDVIESNGKVYFHDQANFYSSDETIGNMETLKPKIIK